MGREANFSEMREAIRQGQAKIAQGLKTGQMRSDRDKADQQTPRTRLDPAHEVLGRKPTLTEKSSVFEPHKKKNSRLRMPSLPKVGLPKIRLPKIQVPKISLMPMRPVLLGMGAVLAVAAAVLVLFWIGKALIGLIPERTSAPVEQPVARQPADVQPVASPPVVQPRPVLPVVTAPAEPVRAVTPPPAATRTGDNVIVIQYITTSRESELRPVQDFFGRNGIATEIMRKGSGSYLVTRDRFENPNRVGSDGHQMLQQIRNVGKRYPAETGDAKFGTEPFQDAYGMLRQ